MVINQWTLATATYQTVTPSWNYKFVLNPYNATAEFTDYMVPPQPQGVYGDLTNMPGLAGQGESSTTPAGTPAEKVFDSHFIVQIGCITSTPSNPQISCISMGNPPVPCVSGNPQAPYGPGTQFFDPSYGVTYSSEAGFEMHSVAGYAQQNFGDVFHGPNYHLHAPVSGAPNICFTPLPGASM